jgi:hypothetical protein
VYSEIPTCFFLRHIGNLNVFLARKKNCASRFEAKKAVMGEETVRGEQPRGTTTVPERAIVALYYSGFFGK